MRNSPHNLVNLSKIHLVQTLKYHTFRSEHINVIAYFCFLKTLFSTKSGSRLNFITEISTLECRLIFVKKSNSTPSLIVSLHNKHVIRKSLANSNT